MQLCLKKNKKIKQKRERRKENVIGGESERETETDRQREERVEDKAGIGVSRGQETVRERQRLTEIQRQNERETDRKK